MLLREESGYGVRELGSYQGFQPRADKVKNDLLAFLIEQKRAGKSVAAYGAAAKGNTLLNYAGVKPDLLPYVCDAAASKQGKYLPGSHIPILARSEEHTSELQSLMRISYAVFCLKKKNPQHHTTHTPAP